MVSLVIFDLDGTLLDTSRDIQRVLNQTLSAYGLPVLTLERTLECVGNGAKKLIERALPADRGELLGEVYAAYAKAFAACDNALTCLYDGEAEVLRELKANGIKTAIVTNKPQDATDGVYHQLLAPFGFDFVVGQSEKYPLKPAPDSTLAVIERAGVQKSDCLFVGDGETDIATARNAGVECVSVLWGYRPRRRLEEEGGKNFVQSYPELGEFIFKH